MTIDTKVKWRCRDLFVPFQTFDSMPQETGEPRYSRQSQNKFVQDLPGLRSSDSSKQGADKEATDVILAAGAIYLAARTSASFPPKHLCSVGVTFPTVARHTYSRHRRLEPFLLRSVVWDSLCTSHSLSTLDLSQKCCSGPLREQLVLGVSRL